MTIMMERPTAPITTTAAMAVTVTAPARTNCAGFCDYCCHQGCQSPRCIDLYLSSWWALCDQCGGLADDGWGNGCPICVHGVIQVMPGHPGAVQPR